MAEYTQPVTLEDVDRNFEQIKPLMNQTEAFYESGRCLFCYDAPCVKACPTGIDIPLFIKQINTHNLNGSAKTIYSANYFGNTCGKVCPTEVLCEGACVFNEQNVKPIEIGRLQSYATTQAIKKAMPLHKKNSPNHKKIAIISAIGRHRHIDGRKIIGHSQIGLRTRNRLLRADAECRYGIGPQLSAGDALGFRQGLGRNRKCEGNAAQLVANRRYQSRLHGDVDAFARCKWSPGLKDDGFIITRQLHCSRNGPTHITFDHK